MTHSVTVREPEYDDRDRALIIASQAAADEPRGRHGIPLSEAMDPKNQFAYEPVGPTVDWAQSAINKAEAEHEAKRAKGDHRSVSFTVRRREANA
ncbi:hypothetical protein [Microbacterium sp.]|uniref:hypothetical protein n=1 Tax=Microbacterium sp. TaxID=51671 RepID=UPI0032426B7E